MPIIGMEAEKDKTTKNFDRFKFSDGNVNGSVYIPKGANSARVTVEYD